MRVVVLLVGLVACVRSQSVTCGDGTVCPNGDRCDEEHQRCISPAQIRACTGQADGAACTTEAGVGVCGGGVCDLPICGDGVREGTEECDGADLGGADCTSTAQIHAQFYEPAGLTCATGCTYDIAACDAYCGDGVINGPEVCDGAAPPNSCLELGLDAGPTRCSDLCGFGFDSCARFGFQFEAIGPGTWTAIGGTGHADQWALGLGGLAAHYNGHGWSVVPTGLPDSFDRVWAVAPADVWATSADALAHWNGAAWARVSGVPAGGYHDIWAAGAGAVYVATDHGVASWDGAAWHVMPGLAGPVFAVAGTSATDLWAAAADTLYHWNGTAWTAAATTAARRIIAFSPTSAWAVGQKASPLGSVSQIDHWDGTTWTLRDDSTVTQLDLAGSSDADVWVLSTSGDLRHWNGHGLVDGSVAVQINGVHSFGPGDVVMVGTSGARRFRGQMMMEKVVQTPAAQTTAIWGDQPDDLFLGDIAGRVHQFDGTRWLPQLPAGSPIETAFGFGPDDVFFGGANGRVDHLTGGVLVDTQFIGAVQIQALWGTSNHDLWAVAAALYHYDGVTWTTLVTGAPGSTEFGGVSGTSTSDVWAFGADQFGGSGDYLYHWDGVAFSLVDTAAIDGLVAVAPDEIYAIAPGGKILHYLGGQRTEVTLPVTTDFVHIAATAPDDVIVATHGELFHFDGVRWSPVRVPSPSSSPPVIAGVFMRPGFIVIATQSALQLVELMLRTRPWTCRAHETNCSDGVDDDCDDLIDARDADCP